MPQIIFPFETRPSAIFGVVKRPIATVDFWSSLLHQWIAITLIVDTGADYTILPSFYAPKLGIHLTKDCKKYPTIGIGGKETVYLLEKSRLRIAEKEFHAPVGFLTNNDVPPLLGRQNCLEVLRVILDKHHTTFATH